MPLNRTCPQCGCATPKRSVSARERATSPVMASLPTRTTAEGSSASVSSAATDSRPTHISSGVSALEAAGPDGRLERSTSPAIRSARDGGVRGLRCPVTRLVSHVRGAVCCSPSCARDPDAARATRACETCGQPYIAATRVKGGQPGTLLLSRLQWSVASDAAAQEQNPGQRGVQGSGGSPCSRDDFTCQRCYLRAGRTCTPTDVKFGRPTPELRFEVDNGLTLCMRCHGRIHGDMAVLH